MVVTVKKKAPTLACAYSSVENCVLIVFWCQTLVQISKLVSEHATKHVFELFKLVERYGHFLLYGLNLTTFIYYTRLACCVDMRSGSHSVDLCIVPFVQIFDFDLLKSQC